jgi:type II secretory pathway pseudopilin PulG
MRFKYQKGQTIIEAIVALMTILLIITAIAIVIVNGLYNSTFIKNQNQANKYAQQGIEFVRNIQRNDLGTFGTFNQNATYCIDEANDTLTSTSCETTGTNTGTNFNRTIVFSPSGGQCPNTEIKVTVTVKWSSTKCPSNNTFCHKSELVSCMPYAYPASNP